MNNKKTSMVLLALAMFWSGCLWASDGHHGRVGHGEHGAHDVHTTHSQSQEIYRVTPSLPEVIEAGKPLPLIFEITEQNGTMVDRFDVVHEELLHLIVVGSDLDYFDHIHPQYLGKGRFAVTTALPSGGTYTFFSDYKPAGKSAQVSSFTVQVAGNPAPAPTRSTVASQVQGNTLITLTTEPAVVQAGDKTVFNFTLNQAADRLPVRDLKPYLGEMGHLVIVRNTTPLSINDYIHTHALTSTESSIVAFAAALPTPGWYKLFAQFNRDGTLLTAPYWLHVE